MRELDISNRETEIENLKARLLKERQEFESEQQERYLRDI